ncbi:flagellar basal body P-ring formation chaperone FlgA [Sodalis endosymbiont of Spalangia cameroni]|uniref:flagellar basal body P-ring formation chaperone FlgA n=1 Tax=Sodalis praecaptivus TaxID=1239307 RepID=UPI0031F8C341
MKGSMSCGWKPLSQLCLLLFPLTVAAENGDALVTRLESLLRQQRVDSSLVQKVTLKTPAKLLPDCPSPHMQLASHGRLSGNMSVTARCGERRYFLQILVRARGDYWVAARALPAGTSLSAKDIVKEHGELVGQARNVIFATQPVTGSLTTRTLQAGQPLAATLLRAPWKVRQGNPVAVVSRGPGFQVRHYGKAMSDAAVGDTLRVRLASGQMVSGAVDNQGVVLQNERAFSSFSAPGR